MKIEVKILSGKVETLDVDDDTKVEGVKEILEQKIGVVKSEMILLYTGKALKDGTSLQDAKIKDGCRLFLAFKTRGIAKKNVSQQSSQTSTKSSDTTPSSSQVSEVKYGEGGRFHSLLLEFLKSHYNEQDACKVADAVFKQMRYQIAEANGMTEEAQEVS